MGLNKGFVEHSWRLLNLNHLSKSTGLIFSRIVKYYLLRTVPCDALRGKTEEICYSSVQFYASETIFLRAGHNDALQHKKEEMYYPSVQFYPSFSYVMEIY